MNGETIAILQDRDPLRRGCRPDLAELPRATQLVMATPEQRTDTLVLKEFSKAEAEGGRFRHLVVQASEASDPASIPERFCNLEPLMVFAGDLAQEGSGEAALASFPAAGPALPARKATDRGAKDRPA